MLKLDQTFADKHNCRVLNTPGNTISIGMHLAELKDEAEVTSLGAILYSRRVMGHRIVAGSEKVSKIGNQEFNNYGSHSD